MQQTSPSCWFAQMLGEGDKKLPSKGVLPRSNLHNLSVRPMMSYGVFADIARSAARLACGQSSGKLGRAIGSVPSQNLKKVLPISPNARIAIGMNEKFASMISPITSSADRVFSL